MAKKRKKAIDELRDVILPERTDCHPAFLRPVITCTIPNFSSRARFTVVQELSV